MIYEGIIGRDPKVMVGKPIIKGTRITVELIVRKMAGGFSINDISNAYPHLTETQIKAALEYAADVISNEILLEV